MEITAVRNTDDTTPSTTNTTAREQSSTQTATPGDESFQSAATFPNKVGLNLSTSGNLSSWTKESILSTSSEFVTFITWQTEESITQNIDQSNSKASVRVRIIMIATISSTSFILLLIFLGWIGIHYRRRQVNRKKHTGGSRVLPALPNAHGDEPLNSNDYSRNHTYNLPFSTSLESTYESVPDKETPNLTKTCRFKRRKKCSKSKQVVKDLPSKVIQPSDDYATYADIPELLSSSTGYVTSSIVHADVHRLSTFATEKGHHVDHFTRQCIRVIDASGYLSPNVEMSSNNHNPSLQDSSEDKGKNLSHTYTDAVLTVANTESAMLDEGNVIAERPDDIIELGDKYARDVNAFISKPSEGEEAPYEVLEDNLLSDIKSSDDDMGYAAVDEIRKSQTDNLGYEVPNDTVREKDNEGYYEVTHDDVMGNDYNVKYEEVPALIANYNFMENQSESDGLVPNIVPSIEASLSKSTTATEGKPNSESDTEDIQHSYMDCGNTVVKVGSHPENISIDSEGKDNKYSVIPERGGGMITEPGLNDTVGKIPHQTDESNVDGLGYLVPRKTELCQKKSAKNKIDQGETSTEIGTILHTYLDCSGSMLIERGYSEISNDDSSLGPRHSGKASHCKKTPYQIDGCIDKKLSVCTKVTDQTYTPRLQHTYHGLEELTQKQSQDESSQHQAGRSSGGKKSKFQISKNSGICSGKKQEKE